MSASFFNHVRPLFGRLKTHQVEGMEKIVEYARTNGVSRIHLAYMLATVFHETAKWMQPIREGARRYGPRYSDASSRNAVASIFAKGIISRNYALPDLAGNSFYGRGLVQITHKTNYAKFGIAATPDKALEWPTALRIMHHGMRDGTFTGKSLDMLVLPNPNYKGARAIINGDVRKNGPRIARLAVTFYDALDAYKPRRVSHEPGSNQSTWPPRWWPFRTS